MATAARPLAWLGGFDEKTAESVSATVLEHWAGMLKKGKPQVRARCLSLLVSGSQRGQGRAERLGAGGLTTAAAAALPVVRGRQAHENTVLCAFVVAGLDAELEGVEAAEGGRPPLKVVALGTVRPPPAFPGIPLPLPAGA